MAETPTREMIEALPARAWVNVGEMLPNAKLIAAADVLALFPPRSEQRGIVCVYCDGVVGTFTDESQRGALVEASKQHDLTCAAAVAWRNANARSEQGEQKPVAWMIEGASISGGYALLRNHPSSPAINAAFREEGATTTPLYAAPLPDAAPARALESAYPAALATPQGGDTNG